MATVQSNLSAIQSNQSPIDQADRAQKRIFVVSVLFGIFAALVGALFAWLLWRANNTYQATVKAVTDAEAKRIETEAGVKITQAQAVAEQAKEGASKADERASKADQRAGEASERAAALELRAQELEKQNLKVRSSMAGLEKEAADARAEQQRIQTEMARQQERAANAERALTEIQERASATEARLEEERRNRLGLEEWLKPRVLVYTFSAGKTSLDALKPFAGTQVIIEVIDDDEARQLAEQIARSVEAAGWKVMDAVVHPKGTRLASGVTIESKRNIPDPNRPETMTTPLMPAARTLRELLTANKLQAASYEVNITWPASVPDTVMFVKVGLKPDTYFPIKAALGFWRGLLEKETDPERRKGFERMIEMLEQQLQR